MRDRIPALEPSYDLLVIGGGINGAGVARDAALRGLRVLLIEQNDFGSGTSSRSSKLIHGGLRYLEHGQLQLVREACHERQILLHLAPHLVRPLPFVFPVFEDSRIDPLRLRIGMWLYDVLAAFRNVRRHHMLDIRDRNRRLTGLRGEGLRAAALYYDALMNDARLVLANVLSAQEAGAVTLNHVRARRILHHDGVVEGCEIEDPRSVRPLEIRARVVVLCTGAWTNRLLGPVSDEPGPVAPTRGTHIVIPRITEQAFTLAAERDGRVFFVLPWLGLNLVGTTDVASGEDADHVIPSEEEVAYLLDETNRFFPAAKLQRDDVISAFAGLRPLQRAEGVESSRSREHSILEPMRGLLAVIGGKYTTYRSVAEEVVDRVSVAFGQARPCRTAALPLPGGDFDWSPEDHWQERGGFAAALQRERRASGLPEATVRRLLSGYGTRASAILDLVRAEPELAAPVCSHQPELRAEVVFAIRDEMAVHLDDWFLRRSQMGFRACHGLDALETVAELFARELDWDPAERGREIFETNQRLQTTALRGSPASNRSS